MDHNVRTRLDQGQLGRV